jgi:ferric-dicitrate binding protein FerR (iron transport regulator)
MDCLSPEQLVSYVRGGGADPRAVEAHVRDCPACAMEMLLARETMAEFRSKASRPASDRFRAVARPTRASWVPWVAAAAILVAVVLFAVLSQNPSKSQTPIAVKPEPKPKPAPLPAPMPETPKPEPRPEPKPEPKPDLPKPEPKPPDPAQGRPEPRPEPKPEPVPVKPPEPVKPPPAPEPKPEPEPRKPAPQPTVAEKAVVARVLHAVGGPATNAGRTIRAGEALATARAEFLDVAVEGYGRLYFRENTQAEIGVSGDVVLHEGEMLARLDPGKRLGSLKTPVGPVEVQAPLVNVLASKTSAEISILSGRVIMATTTSTGASTLLIKAGKAPEVRPLEAGFASWLPDKLAARKFAAWYEAEDFPTLQGFKVTPSEGASSGKVATQIAETGVLALKTGLPFKGKHAVWIRVRQYEPKSAVVGIHLGGQSAGDVKLDWDGKPWRWIGPLVITADKLDLAIAALSRFPLKEGDERRSFPVVVDVVHVTSDLKAVPPQEKFGEGIDLVLDEPGK